MMKTLCKLEFSATVNYFLFFSFSPTNLEEREFSVLAIDAEALVLLGDLKL